jgi:hypothetical protein
MFAFSSAFEVEKSCRVLSSTSRSLIKLMPDGRGSSMYEDPFYLLQEGHDEVSPWLITP